jgi:hypothetical protein
MPKSPNCRYQFWGPNRETLHHLGFEAQPRDPPPILRPNQEKTFHQFWGQTGENRPSGFDAKPLTNRRSWFWGSTKKHMLLVSICIVQTTHSVTQPPDRPAIEYPTYAIIPGSLHLISYSCHDPHRCPPCRTCHLHTTRQANMILHMKQRIKIKQKNIPDSNSNLTKSMTHHNQTKELTTWFLTCNTLCYSSTIFFLITFIRGLIMHQVLRLRKF